MICFGFEDSNLNRIEAFVKPGNEAYAVILEKMDLFEKGCYERGIFLKAVSRWYCIWDA